MIQMSEIIEKKNGKEVSYGSYPSGKAKMVIESLSKLYPESEFEARKTA